MIWTWIDGVVGEHADHLPNCEQQIFNSEQLCRQTKISFNMILPPPSKLFNFSWNGFRSSKEIKLLPFYAKNPSGDVT